MKNIVELLTIQGSDEDIACAAWTSSNLVLTEERKARIPNLIASLWGDGHHTPFEHTYLKFKLTVDNATHIHLLRHRIGFSFNVESARYREYRNDKFYIPEDWPLEAQEVLKDFSEKAFTFYHKAIDILEDGGLSRARAKESARYFLTMNLQLEMIVSCNLRSFLNFQVLRNTPEAQKEVRGVAQDMLVLVESAGNFANALLAAGLIKE